MGVRIGSVQNTTIVNATIVTTAETAIATSDPIGQAIDNAVILVLWYFLVTLAAGTNLLTWRVRRGSGITGAAINVPTGVTVTASTVVSFSGVYRDTPGVVAAQQYTLSLVCGAAGANATVNDVAIAAMVL